MLNALIVIAAAGLAGWLLLSRRLRESGDWKAMLTPLASIMGSGFLVSAPLLADSVGVYALPCMAALLLLSYMVGWVIRFNIAHFEPVENKGPGAAQSAAFVSRLVLAIAYFISVTYYLQLLAAFSMKALGLEGAQIARAITSASLVIICGVGIWKGLSVFERLERHTTALNLAMIGGLLLALLVHNLSLLGSGNWQLPRIDSGVGLHDIQILLGLLIIVQGFETSRYLGHLHPAEQRIRTMRDAQLLSGAIYILFIGLATVLFSEGPGADVTAIISMTKPVAAVLPVLLSIAAIGSQFSAATADSAGAGGLVEDLSGERLPERHAYILILAVTLGLAWLTDVNAIIAIASRAFALYYCLQCLVALLVASGSRQLAVRILHLLGFAVMALLCLAVTLFGIPAG
ncbi:hypothetical protein KDL44_10740 [bacterium]|nr:hypothetical protein [bacterium]